MVEPNSTIIVCSGVPFDRDNEHTILFSNPGQQSAWFEKYKILTLENYSYQRQTSGVIQPGCTYAQVMRANYLLFKNTSYENKWFYAFVDNVEYVNDAVCLIHYTIDVMQTWQFDYELRYCFLERQHGVTDIAGDNLQPEPVQVGEPVYERDYSLVDCTPAYVVISVTQDSVRPYGAYQANLYDKVMTGSSLWVFKITDVTSMLNFVRYRENDSEHNRIVNLINGIYVLPKFSLNPDLIPSGGARLASGFFGESKEVSLGMMHDTELFGSYRPVNKKIYTYPYNYLMVSNGRNSQMALRYEYFRENTPRFYIYSTITRPVELCVRPVAYSGAEKVEDHSISKLEGLSLSGFPSGQWNNGGFDSWWSLNSTPMAINSLAGTIGNVLTGNISGVIGEVANAMGTTYRQSQQLSGTNGTLNSGGADVVHGIAGLYYNRIRLHSQVARSIDGFWTLYGYAQNRMGIPNCKARPHYTYVKTQGCCLNARCPVDAAEKIRSIFDRGITFWQPGSAVGDYTVDNAPG